MAADMRAKEVKFSTWIFLVSGIAILATLPLHYSGYTEAWFAAKIFYFVGIIALIFKK